MPSPSRPGLARVPAWSPFLVSLFLVLIGVLFTSLELNRARQRDADRLDDLTLQAEAAVEQLAARVEAGQRATAALIVHDGTIDRQRFAAAAGELADIAAPVSGVALALRVEDADRAQFEQEYPIVEAAGGGTVPASRRDVYFPVVEGSEGDQGPVMYGFDIAGEADRADALERSISVRRPVATHPVVLASTEAPGVVVVLALTDGDRVLGAITIGYDATDLVAQVDRTLPPTASLELYDGNTLVAGSVPTGPREQTEVAAFGRTWTVVVGDSDTTPRRGAMALGLASVFTALVVGLLLEQARRSNRAMAEANIELGRSRATTAALQRLSTELALSATTEEVGEVAARRAINDFGASSARITLAGHLAPLVTVGEVGDEGAETPITGGVTMSLVADRRTIGALAIGGVGSREAVLGHDDLETYGELTAQALRRARLNDADHELAAAITNALLPRELPTAPGLRFSAIYRPAARDVGVGGDWYDVFELGDGRIGVAVGDVVGRGAVAAAVMGQLRAALRAFALVGEPPASVLRRMDLFAATLEGAENTTVLYAVVDPAARHLTIARAGHPPPVVVDDDGWRAVDGGLAPPLGWQLIGVMEPAEVDLAPGACVVLFTDGLIERRDESFDVGFRRLGDHVAACRRETGSVAAVQVGALRLDGRDDVAIIVVQFDVEPG